MPKTKKNKSKDNVVPLNKPKTDKEADEKLKLRESEKDRLNTLSIPFFPIIKPINPPQVAVGLSESHPAREPILMVSFKFPSP